MTTAWNIATIAFQPYPDVGEFVNVGALAVAMPDRLLAFRLLPAQTTSRIHAFFPELDLAIYKEGRRRLDVELERLEMAVNHTQGEHLAQRRVPPGQPPLPGTEGTADTLFKSLTAPRDGLFRFHAKGTRLADSAEDLLDGVFERYIIRITAASDDPEEMRLVHEVSHLLDEWKVRRHYRRDVRVGTDAFHVRFPFGYQPDESAAPQRVIKPLNLAQANSTQIYHHGDMWIANLKRLRNLKAMPARVMLPVKMPLATRGASRECIAAAEEMVDQLRQTKITIAPSDDHRALREFAEIVQDTDLTLTA